MTGVRRFSMLVSSARCIIQRYTGQGDGLVVEMAPTAGSQRPMRRVVVGGDDRRERTVKSSGRVTRGSNDVHGSLMRKH